MKTLFRANITFALLALGLGMVPAPGCGDDQATTSLSPVAPTIEPNLSHPRRAVEDLKKDIKLPGRRQARRTRNHRHQS